MPQEARLKLPTLLREGDSHFMVIGVCRGVMGMPGASNYLEFSYKLFDAPEEVGNMARRNFERGLEQEQALRDAGVVAVYGGGYGGQPTMAPFLIQSRWIGFILPYIRKMAEKLKEMGMDVMLHTDGDLAPTL